MRALILDDSKAMRIILGRMLKAAGFEIHEAGSGREGVDKLKEIGSADLVLVDWNMPEMNGLEFVQAVRADETYNDMRIMMVTTETEAEQVVEALEAGANEYVMKPFTEDVILGKLELLGIATKP